MNTFPWIISCNPCGCYSRGTKKALSPPSCKWEIIGLASEWHTRTETLSLLFPRPGFSSLTSLLSPILSSEWGTQEKVLASDRRTCPPLHRREDGENGCRCRRVCWTGRWKYPPNGGEVNSPLRSQEPLLHPYFRGTSSSCILGLSLFTAQGNVPTQSHVSPSRTSCGAWDSRNQGLCGPPP